MNNSHEDIMNNLQNLIIGIDDMFRFKCRECGGCCKNREDILLNSRDLFNIAKKLGITVVQVLEQYCEIYIGQQSKIPVARLMPRGTNRACPLLARNKCRVHDSKPTVCALFPLGRVIVGEKATKGLRQDEPKKLQYIINPIHCGNRKHKHTVRSWLERFNIPIDDEFFIMWSELVLFLSITMNGYEEQQVSDKLLNLMWQAIINALYTAYDIKRDFMEQFIENRSKVTELFSAFKTQIT